MLLSRGADVNARAVNGSTPLFYAAEADRAEALRLLLDHGADPNIPGRSGLRPLAAAAYNGSEESVERLLKQGADPNALDDDGKGAVVYAAGRGYAPIVALLIAAGVDVNRRYGHGLTALMWAAGPDARARGARTLRRPSRRSLTVAQRSTSRTIAARPPPTSPAGSAANGSRKCWRGNDAACAYSPAR